jgi:hypothetical protein
MVPMLVREKIVPKLSPFIIQKINQDESGRRRGCLRWGGKIGSWAIVMKWQHLILQIFHIFHTKWKKFGRQL